MGLVAALTLVAPTAARATATTAIPPAQYCDIRITVAGQWVNGYVLTISVQNISNVPVVVSASVQIPPPGYVVQAWNVTATVDGSTTWLRPWNPILLPGQTVYFGYVGSGPYTHPTVVCQPAA